MLNVGKWRKTKEKARRGGMNAAGFRGADGSRNRDLFDANEALYQLSYSPLDVTLLCRATLRTLVRSVYERNSVRSRVAMPFGRAAKSPDSLPTRNDGWG